MPPLSISPQKTTIIDKTGNYEKFEPHKTTANLNGVDVLRTQSVTFYVLYSCGNRTISINMDW